MRLIRPTPIQLGLAREVFGPAAGEELPRRVRVYETYGRPYCAVPTEEGEKLAVFLPPEYAGKYLPFVHEMAHAYHALYLPGSTASASDDVCETIAAVAELRAVEARRALAAEALRRSLYWDEGVRRRLRHGAVHLARLECPFHVVCEEVFRIG